MNHLELRLQGALRDAVPVPELPAGLLGHAADRATRIRRRRLATRSALGVAALAGSGVALAQGGPVAPVQRLEPLASASASAAATPGVRLTHDNQCKTAELTPGMTCSRTTLEIHWGDEPAQPLHISERYSVGAAIRTAPPRSLVVHYADGTSKTYSPRAVGPNSWVFDVVLPERSQVLRLTVLDNGGESTLMIRQEP